MNAWWNASLRARSGVNWEACLQPKEARAERCAPPVLPHLHPETAMLYFKRSIFQPGAITSECLTVLAEREARTVMRDRWAASALPDPWEAAGMRALCP